MTLKYSREIELEVIDCPKCFVPFGADTRVVEEAINEGLGLYCPGGCKFEAELIREARRASKDAM